MTRPLRNQYPGAYLHIMSRGNAQQPIFNSDTDRRCWLHTLNQILHQFEWRCFAYVLMDNHYHLFIQIKEENLSEGMRELNGLYTQRFNKNNNRVGHLFQGRFQSQLVENDSYFLELVRYIILNPIRAKMTQQPEDWRWTSYQNMLNPHLVLPLIDTKFLFSEFGGTIEQVSRFLQEGIEQQVQLPKSRNGILGSAMFCESIAQGNMLSNDRFYKICERGVGRPTLREIFNGSQEDLIRRNQLIHLARRTCKYRICEIADYLNLHPSSVSRIINRC